MTIRKFEGNTKEEAIAAAKQEMGDNVVIMSVKTIRKKGLMGFFRGNIYEATAAIEDEAINSFSFDVSADENIKLPPLPSDEVELGSKKMSATVLKDAFAEVGKVVEAEDERVTPSQKAMTIDSLPNSNKSHESHARVKTNETPVRPISPQEDSASSHSETAKTKPMPAQTAKAPQTETKKTSNTIDNDEYQSIYKLIYKTLLDNDVDEKYINALMKEVGPISKSASALDFMISNIYQKMILNLSEPSTIKMSDMTKVVFFIGPTGVGKTTTIAKLASKFILEDKKKVALITADTYRVAATDQLRTYADILGAPIKVVFTKDELSEAVESFSDYNLILIDTAGFSHRSESQKKDVSALIHSVPEGFDKSVYLVLSSTTKYVDLIDIAETYKSISEYNLILTKLDETNKYGNIYNICVNSGAPLSYVTTGQNVPADIESFDAQKLVKKLLGGK